MSQDIRTIHELKTWPEYFEAVRSGAKTYEIRKDDRGFRVGDVLRLREYLPVDGCYTGEEVDVEVTYVTSAAGLGCLAPGHVCMAVRRRA